MTYTGVNGRYFDTLAVEAKSTELVNLHHDVRGVCVVTGTASKGRR